MSFIVNDNSTITGTVTGKLVSSSTGDYFCSNKTVTMNGQTFIDTLKSVCEIVGSDSEIPLEMPNSKTYLCEKNGDLKIGIYRDGKLHDIKTLIPAISDVQLIEDRVVIVSFADGTKEKAVLSKEDSFSFELGISICLTKKLLSMKTNGNGSSVYNKLIDHFIGFYHKQKKEELEAIREAERQEQIDENHRRKEDKKKEKKAKADREAQIEVYKEAYLRALKEFNGTSAE